MIPILDHVDEILEGRKPGFLIAIAEYPTISHRVETSHRAIEHAGADRASCPRYKTQLVTAIGRGRRQVVYIHQPAAAGLIPEQAGAGRGRGALADEIGYLDVGRRECGHQQLLFFKPRFELSDPGSQNLGRGPQIGIIPKDHKQQNRPGDRFHGRHPDDPAPGRSGFERSHQACLDCGRRSQLIETEGQKAVRLYRS